MVALARGVHPLARPELDRGELDPARRIANLSLVFRLSPAQRADREALKRALLDPASPSYHRWLTPEEYAARFGAKPADVARASAWLASQGLEVHGASRLGSRLTFSGSVAKLEAAFHAPLHRFEVHGAMHYAMTAPPQVPAALADVVLDVTHTHDFFGQPVPDYQHAGTTGFAPPDWANVYDVAPAYTTGVKGAPVTGSGVTIAVLGSAPIAQSDVDAWRSTFGLPASTVTMTLVPDTGAAQPGSNGAAVSGVMQVEWAGGIAPGATVNYVYTGGDDQSLDDAAYYVIENDLASVLSEAGGTCENVALQAGFTQADQSVVDVYASAANILGITYVAPAGDEGAAGCLVYGGDPGLYVDMPASYPGVTAVGGTAFAVGSFVTGANGYFTGYSGTEHVWNDANNDTTGVAATGGGISSLFSRPDYQSAVPTCPIVGSLPSGGGANMRQLPDVAFTAGGAAATSIPSFFECTFSGTDCTATGGSPTLLTAAGTSFAASAFAGVVALMDQVAGGPLGNINPLLYGLQASTPSAFHDVTTGNNEVTCSSGMDPGCPAGGLYGYAASTGYDCASGLGSVDAFNLLSALGSLAPTTATLAAAPMASSPGAPVTLTATITVPTPNASALAGNVAFAFQSYTAAGTPDLSWTIGTSAVTAGTVASGVATLAAPIPPGLVNPAIQYVDVYASYEGDAAHLPSRSASARITFSPSTLCVSPATLSIGTLTNFDFTATGGATPITWFVRRDSTCDSNGICSSIDASGGQFFSGPRAGWVVVGALDSNGVEQIANVTVGSPDAGSPPWGSMGTPPGACTMSIDAGADAMPDAAGPPDAATGDAGTGTDAGLMPEAGPGMPDAAMPTDGSASNDASGSGSPDGGAEAGEDASGDAASSTGGSGSSSGCGCIVPASGTGFDSPVAGGLSTLAILAVSTRRRRRA